MDGVPSPGFALAAGGWYGYNVYHEGDRALKQKDEQLASFRNELIAKQDMLDQQTKKLQERDRTIVALNDDLRVKEERIQKLDTSLRLLKVNHRVAWLTVLEQDTDPATNQLYTVGQFVEVNEQGQPIGTPKEFRINGDIVDAMSMIVHI